MKTIEVAGSPFNVDEATASSILNARQARQNNKVAQEAKHMASAAMEQAARIEIMGDRPLYLDSLELANGLHQDGLLDVLYVGDETVFITPRFAQELRAEGLIHEVHTDRKAKSKCGRGWTMGSGKCVRAEKGASKRVKAGSKSLDKIAGGGRKNAKRSARLKELRMKFTAEESGVQNTPILERASNGVIYRALARTAAKQTAKPLEPKRKKRRKNRAPAPELPSALQIPDDADLTFGADKKALRRATTIKGGGLTFGRSSKPKRKERRKKRKKR